MSLTTPKTSTLILSVSSLLTDDQRAAIISNARAELPPDVGVLVLDKLIAGHVIESAS